MNRAGRMRWLGLTAFFLLSIAGLKAQLASGDWIADASGGYRYASLRQISQAVHEYSFSADAHFFPLHRLALGARLSNTFVALNNDFLQSSALLFSIEPNLRYYVLDGRLPLFVQGGYYWQQELLSISLGADDNASANSRGFSAGLGANIFTSGRACLEGLLEFSYRELNAARQPDFRDIRRSWSLGLRLRTWLSESPEGAPLTGPGLDAVSSGGWMAGGRASGALIFNEPGPFAIAATGGIFLVDRFALGLSLEMTGAPHTDDYSRSVEPFARYYLPVDDNTLLFPTLGYTRGKSEAISPFGFESYYFNTWRLGMGMDNFLSEKIALELVFNLAGRNITPAVSAAGRREFDLSFGLTVGIMGYW
ncbi:MAG: hypothetical protein H6564_22870 [Lewinellaceae bacterium]|nr:hypothetical protein [Lewinellaceae bacterium]